MIIMGLDIATSLGVAVWSEGVIVHREIVSFPPAKDEKANSPSRFRRWAMYAAAIEDLITQWAITHVFVEGYGYANPRTLATLVEVGTSVRQVLHDSDVRWHEVPPGTLKKFMTGKGNSPKAVMIMHVFKRFQIECQSDDDADAVALAFFGACYQGVDVGLPEAFMEAARALRTGGTKKTKRKKRLVPT